MAIKIDKRKVGRVATGLTKLLKDEIKRQDLIDTGKMLRETASKVKVDSNGEFVISVISTSYYKYVDGRFNVTDNAFKGPKFNKLVDRLGTIIAEAFEASL